MWISLYAHVYTHHTGDSMDATDGITCLRFEVEGMPLLRRLDLAKSVDAMRIDSLMDLLHTPDDPRLPARAGSAECTWTQCRVNNHMTITRPIGMLAWAMIRRSIDECNTLTDGTDMPRL